MAHLEKVNSSKVFIVDNLEQMLEISEDLYRVAEAEKIVGLKLEKMRGKAAQELGDSTDRKKDTGEVR